jgi:hypothetical protein
MTHNEIQQRIITLLREIQERQSEIYRLARIRDKLKLNKTEIQQKS